MSGLPTSVPVLLGDRPSATVEPEAGPVRSAIHQALPRWAVNLMPTATNEPVRKVEEALRELCDLCAARDAFVFVAGPRGPSIAWSHGTTLPSTPQAVPKALVRLLAKRRKPAGAAVLRSSGTVAEKALLDACELGPMLLVTRRTAEGAWICLGLSPAFALLPETETLGEAAAVFGAALVSRQDWSSLQDIQLRYRALQSSQYLGVLVVDQAGRIHEANDTALLRLERSRAELERGQISWIDHTPVDQRPADTAAIRDLTGKTDPLPWRKQIQNRRGVRSPVLISGVPLEDGSDRSMLVVLDVSLLQKAEDALQEHHAQVCMVAELSKRFIGASPEELGYCLKDSVEKICKMFQADLGILFEFSDDPTVANNLHWWSTAPIYRQRHGNPPGAIRLGE